MFDSLADQMKHDDAAGTNSKERVMKWAVIAVVSVVLFSGLIVAIKMAGGG